METGEKKLRVLMGMDTYLPTVDGVINCMHNYCLNLQQQEQVLAIAPKNNRRFRDDKLPYPINRCISVYIPGVKYHYGLPSLSLRFRRNVEGMHYDIIHVHGPFGMASYVARVARKKGIPMVATYHSNFQMIIRNVIRWEPLADMCLRYIGRNLNRMDEVFVCSPNVAAQARAVGYTGSISYLPFGTDFRPAADKATLRALADEKLNIGEDELVFLYVGRLMPLKRVDLILDSLKLLRDRGVKFRFYVVGTGLHAEPLKAQAARLGFMREEVIFLGFVDRELFPALYSRADLFLFPSIYDNFGLVKVEAAAYQTPGVFIRGSAAGHGVTDGVDGYLSENSAEAFAARIADAVRDRKQLRQAGIRAGENLYIHWSDCVRLLTARYRQIIERKNGNES